MIDRPARHLFGRHVRRRPHHDAGFRARGRASALAPAGSSASRSFARPKSSTFTRPSLVTMTLAGFRSRWTMPFSCAAASASASSPAISMTRVDREAALRDEQVERLSFDELHREEVDALGLFDRVERDDVRMVQRGDGAGFALEAREAIGIARRLGGQHLERDVAAELRVGRAVDLTHGARANLRGNTVVPERPSGHSAMVPMIEK